MKKIILISLLVASVLSGQSLPTFVTLVNGDTSAGENYINIPDGYKVEIVSLILKNSSQYDPSQNDLGSRLWINSNQNNFNFNLYVTAGSEIKGLPTFISPIQIEVDEDTSGPGALAMATLKITPIGQDTDYLPNNAIVVPSHAEGNFEVELQGSDDLLSWVSVSPGVFETGRGYRFFRAVIRLK